jgi:hypothetical protein
VFSVDHAQGRQELVEPTEAGDPVPAAEHTGAEAQHVGDAAGVRRRHRREHVVAELQALSRHRSGASPSS